MDGINPFHYKSPIASRSRFHTVAVIICFLDWTGLDIIRNLVAWFCLPQPYFDLMLANVTQQQIQVFSSYQPSQAKQVGKNLKLKQNVGGGKQLSIITIISQHHHHSDSFSFCFFRKQSSHGLCNNNVSYVIKVTQPIGVFGRLRERVSDVMGI